MAPVDFSVTPTLDDKRDEDGWHLCGWSFIAITTISGNKEQVQEMKRCARAKVSLLGADFFAKTCSVLLCAWLSVLWDSSAPQRQRNLILLQNLASEIKLVWFC